MTGDSYNVCSCYTWMKSIKQARPMPHHPPMRHPHQNAPYFLGLRPPPLSLLDFFMGPPAFFVPEPLELENPGLQKL